MRLNPESLAQASSRHPWRTIGAWLLLIAAMGVVSALLLGGVLSNEVAFTNEPESEKAQKVIDAKFATSTLDTEYMVVSSNTQRTWDPAYPHFVQRLKADVERLGRGVVAGPVLTFVDVEAQAAQLFTPDRRGTLVMVQLTGDPAPVIAKLEESLPSAAPQGFQARMLSLEELTELMKGTQQEVELTDLPEAVILVSSPTATIIEPAFAEAAQTVKRTIVGTAGRALASPPFSGFDARQQAASLVSSDGRTTLVPVPITEATSSAIVEDLREVASANSNNAFTVQVAGQAALFEDMVNLAEEDVRSAESMGLLFALVVLVVVFGSIVAALLPILMGLFAIAVALGLVAVIGQVVDFTFFVTNMITMVGLAVGIDYSLFIVSRYREERKKGFEKLDAIRRSGATANRAVFFSGMTVVLALCGMLFIPVSIFRSLAGGAILVTLAAIAASMTLLPAILALLGDRINWPRLSQRARIDAEHDPRGGFWDRLTRGVMARPVAFLVASVLVLGGLASFYLQIHRGTSQNVSTLPPEFPSRQAFLTLQREFNAGGVTDPAQIVVTGDVSAPETRAAVARLRALVAKDPAFSEATTVSTSVDGSALMVSAYFRGDPMKDQAFQGVRDLRSTIVPKAFDGASATTVLVGGNTAFFTDFLDIADRYQWIVVAFVLSLSFVLLTVVFRSIVLPIKAILMNLLSVGAAYGAVTLVFQKGVGIGLFNDLGFPFKQVEAIEGWLPLFLFSVLFGLSMDYHVFLLARIREEYDKTGDNTEAVGYGLRTTAGIITGAALIMVAVFSAFARGRLGQFQQMGFGLAVAVLLDATIVRTLLVPAGMRLLGDWNWYLPRWLQWLPELRVEGGEPDVGVPSVARSSPVPERMDP
ncbi:MAG: MMPL family transporter [Actinomycetota bacterium]